MAACPPQALLRFPLEAVKQVAMLTVQDHIGIPDPPCSVFPKTQLQSTAPGGGQLHVRPSCCLCLAGCSLHSHIRTSLGCSGRPHFLLIKAEASQPGDLLLTSSVPCDSLMKQLLGAGLCLHVTD